MQLIRKTFSIILLFPLFILLSVALDYYQTSDWSGLFIALIFSLLTIFLVYKIWPKTKIVNNSDLQSNAEPIQTEPELKIDAQDNHESFVEEFTEPLNLNDDVELPTHELDEAIIGDDIYKEVQKPKYIPESIDNREKILIDTYVTGIKYEGRTQIIKDYIKDMIEGGMIEPYGGRKSSEIKEELMYTDDVIWEIEEEVIPYITVIDEPDNEFDSQAMAVYLYDDKIGYVPKNDLKRIKGLRTNAELVDVLATVKGGRYKYVDDEERLRTKSKDYYVNLVLIYKK